MRPFLRPVPCPRAVPAAGGPGHAAEPCHQAGGRSSAFSSCSTLSVSQLLNPVTRLAVCPLPSVHAPLFLLLLVGC